MSYSTPIYSTISKGERLQSKQGSIEHQQSQSPRIAQRNLMNMEKGPDTSTPVTANQEQLVGPGPQNVGVRGNQTDDLDGTSTFSASTSASPGTPKRSFMSENENGTIQAQRHELQLLMSDLEARDTELNDMVKAHHHELLGWEKDRQRILNLEQRNTMAELETKIKNDQVRALIARLKMMESVQQTKQGALDHCQAQLTTLNEQLTQNQLKLNGTQNKSHQKSRTVKELTKMLSKLESKEQEMSCLLKNKDKDLTTAAAHLSELSSKLKWTDNKVKLGERAEAEGQKKTTEWKQRHFELKRVTDKLKCDLNQSQLDEEESRAAVERTNREQEKLRKQILNMADHEKRQDDLIHLQRLKQERVDAELSSVRQLYERQQRDMAVLYLNLDTARDMMTKHRDSSTDNSNMSQLPRSPTSGRTVAYHTQDTTVTIPAGSRLDSSQRSSTSRHSDRRTQGLISALDTDRPTSAVVERLEAQVSAQKQRDQQQKQQKEQKEERAAQSFIPVTVPGVPGSVVQSDSSEAQRLAGTPRPGSAIIPQYSGRSVGTNTTRSAQVLATLSTSSDGYGTGQVTLEKRYYQRETGQDDDEAGVVQRVETRQVSYTEDVADRAAGSSTPPPNTRHLKHSERRRFTFPGAGTFPAVGAGREDSVHAEYQEQTGLSVAAVEDDVVRPYLQLPDTSAGWTHGSVSTSSDNELHSYNNMPESSNSKLHRLLMESRQMVQSLERTIYPPFFPQDQMSPIKPDTEGKEE